VDYILVHWPFACAKTEENKVKLGPDDKVRLFELSCLEFDKCCIVYHQEIPHREHQANLVSNGKTLQIR
jgi:hypothetical protein